MNRKQEIYMTNRSSFVGVLNCSNSPSILTFTRRPMFCQFQIRQVLPPSKNKIKKSKNQKIDEKGKASSNHILYLCIYLIFLYIQTRAIKIPDVSPRAMISPNVEFSMTAGEFIESYQDQHGMPFPRYLTSCILSIFLSFSSNYLLN